MVTKLGHPKCRIQQELLWSAHHFIAQVVNSVLLEAMVDTGLVHSLIDLAIVQHLGLLYDPATTTRSHQWYWGPEAQTKCYDGIVPSPVRL